MNRICANCLWWRPNRETMPEYPSVEDRACWCPEQEVRYTDDNFTCEHHVADTDTFVNVPNHCPYPSMKEPNPNPVDGPTEVLVVTYSKDIPWLEYALKSMRTYLRGFQGITIAHPVHESEQFHSIKDQFGSLIRLHAYEEVAGKGMLQHMVKMAEADLIVPPGTAYVLHTDADGIFRMMTTPEDYFWEDKPYQLIRTWASLGWPDPRHPQSKSISDCAQWKPATDRQLGFDTEYYTMCMNTAVMPIEFYYRYRSHISKLHGRSYEDFMLDGQNAFPQSNMDWTAMGAFAHKFMRDRFCWFDVESGHPYPEDRKKAYWSHGGITPEIRSEIEGIIQSRYSPTQDEIERMAQ